jgi:uncharacterized lipoprotein
MFDWVEFTGRRSELPTDNRRAVFVRFANGAESKEARFSSGWSWSEGYYGERTSYQIVAWKYVESLQERMARLEAENV